MISLVASYLNHNEQFFPLVVWAKGTNLDSDPSILVVDDVVPAVEDLLYLAFHRLNGCATMDYFLIVSDYEYCYAYYCGDC